MNSEKSCGAVILRGDEYLVVKHRQGHWDFPKGHVEEGETEEDTAKREVLEETGLKISILPGFKSSISYKVHPRIEKEVVFFLAKPISEEVVLDNNELTSYNWLSYESALKRLSFKNNRQVLVEAHKFIEGRNGLL